MNTLQTITSQLSKSISLSQDNLILEALYIHTGERFTQDTAYVLKGTLDKIVTPDKVEHICLDGREIIQIYPLTFEMDGMIMNTTFNYRVIPKGE